LILPAVVILLLASSLLPNLMGRPVPTLLASLRYPTLMLGGAVPLILAAAAVQLDELAVLANKLVCRLLPSKPARGALAAAAAAAVIWLSLPGPYRFTRHWMLLQETPSGAAEVADRLVTDSPAWVQPAADYYWWLLLASRGQKTTGVYRPWWLDGTPIPPPFLQADRASENPSMHFDSVLNDIGIAVHPDAHYAYIYGDDSVPCVADSHGGLVRVSCPESVAGNLVVMEHNMPGWRAVCDGRPVPLADEAWLTVAGVSGPLTCEFTYFNWEVPAGLAFTLLGICVAISEWRAAACGRPCDSGVAPAAQPRAPRFHCSARKNSSMRAGMSGSFSDHLSCNCIQSPIALAQSAQERPPQKRMPSWHSGLPITYSYWNPIPHSALTQSVSGPGGSPTL